MTVAIGSCLMTLSYASKSACSCASLALLVNILLGCANATTAAPKERHVEWLEEHARPLGSSPSGPLSPEIQSLVADAASSHRYIALAEGDHFVADKYAYRLAFLRDLVLTHSNRQIAMEIGGSDARRIDRFLETGDETWLRKVVLYGYAGDNPLERRELGPYSRALSNDCSERFINAELEFWRELRVLSQAAEAQDGRRIRLYGFDYDAMPGGGFQDARDALAACSDAPLIATIREALTPPSGSGGTAELERLRQLIDEVHDVTGAIDEACGAGIAERTAATLDQLVSSYDLAMERASIGEDPDVLKAHFNDREALMERRMAALTERLEPAENIILLGHNLHLAKSVDQLRFGPPDDARPMWPSLGARLEARTPGSMYVIWLLFAEGTRLQPTAGGCEPEADVELRSGSLEETLSTAGDRYLVALADAPQGGLTDTDFEFGTATSYGGGSLRGAVDALVFLAEARSSR